VLRGGRPGARVIAAIPVAWVGTALLIGNVDRAAFHAKWWQWAISFSSAFTFAFYVMFSKRGLRRYPPETVLLYTFLIAGLLWSVVTPPWRIAAAGYGAEMWGLFLLLAVFSTLVPFACFYAGLRHMPAPEASVLATTEPVVATLSSAVLLGEGLRPIQWLGALLVLTASAYSSLREKEASVPN